MNYGKFKGADIWNSLDESIKSATLNHFNSWATGPVKSRSILEYYFAYSYLRFCTCYVDENTTIRFSEK